MFASFFLLINIECIVVRDSTVQVKMGTTLYVICKKTNKIS